MWPRWFVTADSRKTSQREATAPPTMSMLKLIRSRPWGRWPYGAGNPKAPWCRFAKSCSPFFDDGFAGSGINELSRNWAGSKCPRVIRSASWNYSGYPYLPMMSAVSTMSPVLLHSPRSGGLLSSLLSITQPISSRISHRPLS